MLQSAIHAPMSCRAWSRSRNRVSLRSDLPLKGELPAIFEREDPSMPLLDMEAMCGILRVERAIRGVRGNSFEVPQGKGADCGIVFEIGQRWLYTGWFTGDRASFCRGFWASHRSARSRGH